jgi:peroxiredoxin
MSTTQGLPNNVICATPLSPPLHKILILTAVSLLSLLVIVRFWSTLFQATQKERQGACMALQPEALFQQAPNFKLFDLQGRSLDLVSLRGKVVLLNFWATWCPPCVEELPSMAALQKALAQRQDFVLLTISVDDSPEVVRQFFSRQPDKTFSNLTVLSDPERKIPTAWGTVKFPETYLIDAQGQIRYRFVNQRNWSSPQALSCIESLLR